VRPPVHGSSLKERARHQIAGIRSLDPLVSPYDGQRGKIVPRPLGKSEGATILPILGDRGTSWSRKGTRTFGGFSEQKIRCSGDKDDRISSHLPFKSDVSWIFPEAYSIDLSPKPTFRCRAQRVRRFPRDHIAEAVANVPTDFDERDGTALHAQVLQRLHAALLAIGELPFG
jgi:hypothetical protein